MITPLDYTVSQADIVNAEDAATDQIQHLVDLLIEANTHTIKFAHKEADAYRAASSLINQFLDERIAAALA